MLMLQRVTMITKVKNRIKTYHLLSERYITCKYQLLLFEN